MAFADFKTIDQVLEQYPLKYKVASFLPEAPIELPDLLIENINFSLQKQGLAESEFFFRESFIYPFLHWAWKRHSHLKLWSNKALRYDDTLFGEPDYLVSQWIEDRPIHRLLNRPLLAVAEAKRQDFELGWVQCLAEMIACQKINADESLTVYGVVSTGILWQFGKLTQDQFTRELLSFSIADPQRVAGALDFMFGECEKQLLNQ